MFYQHSNNVNINIVAYASANLDAHNPCSIHSIVAKDIKHMTQTSTTELLLDQVESILLQKNKTLDEEQIFKVAYKKMGGQVFGSGTTQDTLSTTCVKVSIRKTLANSIVRPIWEGSLIPISHANHDTLPIFAQHALPANNDASNQYETTASSLAFSIVLGDTVTKLQKDIIALREENEQLRVNANRWKGTAQRLNNQWQSEKSELTERFLTLFNQHKARHVETKKELDEVKGNQRFDRSSLGTSSEIHREERPEMRVDDEDEHDYETWDDDYVNRMAAGGSTQQKRRRKNPNAAAIRDVLRSDDEQDDGDNMEVAPL